MHCLLSGQTIIEYPTLYFGSYEHTASLQTLIADPAVEAGRSSGGDSNSVGSSGRKTGITELAGGAAASSEAEDERMDVISADEPQSSTRKSVSFLEVSSSRFKASSAPERAVSKELLNIEMDTDDAIKNSSSAFPNTKFNSSNVADIVSNMKHFIDATLCAKANEKEEGEEEEEAVGAVDGIPTPTLRALGNLGGLGGFNFPASASRPAAVSSLLGGVGIGARQGVGVEEELGMEEGEVDDDEGEEGEEENEEFLAMLKELADKDIDTLRAIIAAEEACGEEEGYDSEDDT